MLSCIITCSYYTMLVLFVIKHSQNSTIFNDFFTFLAQKKPTQNINFFVNSWILNDKLLHMLSNIINHSILYHACCICYKIFPEILTSFNDFPCFWQPKKQSKNNSCGNSWIFKDKLLNMLSYIINHSNYIRLVLFVIKYSQKSTIFNYFSMFLTQKWQSKNEFFGTFWISSMIKCFICYHISLIISNKIILVLFVIKYSQKSTIFNYFSMLLTPKKIKQKMIFLVIRGICQR